MKITKRKLKSLISKLNAKKPKDICSNITKPQPNYKDVSWVKIAVTNDQLRIEAELKKLSLKNKRILHVGIGSSNIAKNFINNTIKVDGITVMQEEKKHAESLNLTNYNVYIINKYSNELNNLQTSYDFIIDNNLSSFACCKQHYNLMITNYFNMLNNGGIILTDKMGMNYHEDYAFGIDYEDLQNLENQFLVKVFKLSDFVFAIQKL